MRCICSNNMAAHKNFFLNQILIILVSLNSLLYRNVVASGRARPRGLAPGQRSAKKRLSGCEPLATLCPI